jgi:hypothetical protein
MNCQIGDLRRRDDRKMDEIFARISVQLVLLVFGAVSAASAIGGSMTAIA